MVLWRPPRRVRHSSCPHPPVAGCPQMVGLPRNQWRCHPSPKQGVVHHHVGNHPGQKISRRWRCAPSHWSVRRLPSATNLHNVRNDTQRALQVDTSDEVHDGLEHKFHLHQQPGCGPHLFNKFLFLVVARHDERFAQSVIVRHDARLNTCCRNLQITRVKKLKAWTKWHHTRSHEAHASLLNCKLGWSAVVSSGTAGGVGEMFECFFSKKIFLMFQSCWSPSQPTFHYNYNFNWCGLFWGIQGMWAFLGYQKAFWCTPGFSFRDTNETNKSK